MHENIVSEAKLFKKNQKFKNDEIKLKKSEKPYTEIKTNLCFKKVNFKFINTYFGHFFGK